VVELWALPLVLSVFDRQRVQSELFFDRLKLFAVRETKIEPDDGAGSVDDL
jgi:hypothetical protein